MDNRLIFITSSDIVRVPADAVVYVTADGNYSTLITADAGKFLLSLQLGQVERQLAARLSAADNRFIRIGKSLIVNRDFIAFINPQRQKLTLSDCRTFRHEVTASKDALKSLKELIEEEESL